MSSYYSLPSTSSCRWSNLPRSSDLNLVELIYMNRTNQIENYLQQNPEYDLTKIKASNQYSLLHFACLNNQINTCKLFFTHLKKGDFKAETIKAWVNARTEAGQTALYFASLTGNLDIINLLEENGADVYARDNEGLTLVHAAAQGNQPLSLVYFKTKGLSFHETDYKGRTPLHIAANEGFFEIIRYLTIENTLINLQENEFGYTALHYAVLSGNAQVVVKLLKKGASPNITDMKGQRPIEIASKNSSFVLVQILQEKNCLTRCLGINQRSSRKKFHYTFPLFFVLIFTFLLTHIFFVLPYIENKNWMITLISSFSLTFFFFLLTWLADPGVIHPKEGQDLLYLLKHYSSEQICPDCVILKPPRSRHCEACGVCISVYDHHCTWANNCVGAKNHKYFIVFVFVVWASLVSLIVLDVVHFLSKDPVYKYMKSFTMNEKMLFWSKDIVCACCIVISLGLALPLGYLCYVQIMNLFQGKTTVERLGKKNENKGEFQERSKEFSKLFSKRKQSRFQRFSANIMNMCFRNAQNPEYTDSNQLYRERITNTL